MAVESVEMGMSTTLPIDVDDIIKKVMGCINDTNDENTLKIISDRNLPLPSLIEVIMKTIYKVVGTGLEQFITLVEPFKFMFKMVVIEVPLTVALAPTPALQAAKVIKDVADIATNVLDKLNTLLKFLMDFIADPMGFISKNLLKPFMDLKIPIPEIELLPGLKLPKIDNNNQLETDLFKIKLDPNFALKYNLSIDASFSDILKKLPSISVDDLELLPPQFNVFLSLFKMIKELALIPINMLIGFIEGLLEIVKNFIKLIPTSLETLITLPAAFPNLLASIVEYANKFKPDLDFFKNMVMMVIEPLIKPIMSNPGEPIQLFIKKIIKIVSVCIPNFLLEVFKSLFAVVLLEFEAMIIPPTIPT